MTLSIFLAKVRLTFKKPAPRAPRPFALFCASSFLKLRWKVIRLKRAGSARFFLNKLGLAMVDFDLVYWHGERFGMLASPPRRNSFFLSVPFLSMPPQRKRADPTREETSRTVRRRLNSNKRLNSFQQPKECSRN